MTLTLTPLRLETETVAIIAARHLSWHRVQLPAGVLPRAPASDPMGPRLRSVLEGLLEDRLLDEPATLHFALQPAPYGDDGVWIAVCDRAALQHALQQLQAGGHIVHRLVPESTPVSADSPSPLWLTGTDVAPLALWCDEQGVHQWPLPASATHAATWPAPVTQQLKRAPVVCAEPALAAWAEHALDSAVQVQSAHERLLQHAQQCQWNLAQGPLSLHKAWSVSLQQAMTTLWHAPVWRPARWMAALLLLVQLAGVNVAAWQARRQENQLQTDIATTLTRTFPQIQVVVDAPVQMQRGVAALQQSSGAPTGQDMDVMLQTLHRNLPPALSGQAPNAINYEAGSLRLSGLAWGEEQAQQVVQSLRSHQLELRRDGTDWVVSAGDTP